MTAIEKAIAALEKYILPERSLEHVKWDQSLGVPLYVLKQALTELRAAQGEKVEGLEEAIKAAQSYLHDGDKLSYSYLQHGIILQAAKLQLERQRG